LERRSRQTLLEQTRAHWQSATLLCITHDMSETLNFDRVLVLEDGQIVEDGNPTELSNQTDSLYHALLKAEHQVQEKIWTDPRHFGYLKTPL
jgi:ATP-binding cassette subfamily B protein